MKTLLISVVMLVGVMALGLLAGRWFPTHPSEAKPAPEVRTTLVEIVTVTVAGRVQSPGRVRVGGSPPMLTDALTQAKVWPDLSDLKRVKIHRQRDDGSRREMPVDVTAIAAKRAADVRLEPNDLIYVPERIL